MSLERVDKVVNAVVRCHNFCRTRIIDVPSQNVDVVLPAAVQVDDEGSFMNDYFEPAPSAGGRRVIDQVSISKPREAIRRRLEVEGIVRPRHNVERNRPRVQGGR